MTTPEEERPPSPEEDRATPGSGEEPPRPRSTFAGGGGPARLAADRGTSRAIPRRSSFPASAAAAGVRRVPGAGEPEFADALRAGRPPARRAGAGTGRARRRGAASGGRGRGCPDDQSAEGARADPSTRRAKAPRCPAHRGRSRCGEVVDRRPARRLRLPRRRPLPPRPTASRPWPATTSGAEAEALLAAVLAGLVGDRRRDRRGDREQHPPLPQRHRRRAQPRRQRFRRSSAPARPADSGGPQNILILGSDKRPGRRAIRAAPTRRSCCASTPTRRDRADVDPARPEGEHPRLRDRQVQRRLHLRRARS